jgi:hypothetical protein
MLNNLGCVENMGNDQEIEFQELETIIWQIDHEIEIFANYQEI